MSKRLPLEGITVLEFSQFLAAPSAGLRLADLGARVIKIERPKGGDLCRKLSFKNMFVGDESLLFHTINRNKESFTADLKNPEDLDWVKQLIKKADIITHNFRPGVMEKIGLDYAKVKEINPQIIYAEVSGYGKIGPWKNKPGQDLLVQALSGLTWLSGNDEKPLPFGMSIADIICGAHLVQGILACLYSRKLTGEGANIEVSLMESILDFQFEFLTNHYNGGGIPQKSKVNHAHSLLNAPYGIYETKNGFLAIAMGNLQTFSLALDLPILKNYQYDDAFSKRDEIKQHIAKQLVSNTSDYWKERMDNHYLWCMAVLNWKELVFEDAYKSLQIEQELITQNGQVIKAMRGPVCMNNQTFTNSTPAPLLGQHTVAIKNELSNINTVEND